MNTFVPYASAHKCAEVLEDRRLNNQINEALIILRTLTGWYIPRRKIGWPNHPATKMWAGYEAALAVYALEMLEEWLVRNRKPSLWRCRSAKIRDALKQNALQFEMYEDGHVAWPPWWGREDVHLSHRRCLLFKAPKHYGRYWPDLDPAQPDEKGRLPYVWPVNDD